MYTVSISSQRMQVRLLKVAAARPKTLCLTFLGLTKAMASILFSER